MIHTPIIAGYTSDNLQYQCEYTIVWGYPQPTLGYHTDKQNDPMGHKHMSLYLTNCVCPWDMADAKLQNRYGHYCTRYMEQLYLSTICGSLGRCTIVS